MLDGQHAKIEHPEPRRAPDGCAIRDARETYLADDEPIQIQNPYLDLSKDDISFYHLMMSSEQARQKLSGVKKVVMCGSRGRALQIARQAHDRLGLPIQEFLERPSIREGFRDGDLSKVRNWAIDKIRKAVDLPVKITSDKRYDFYLVGDTLVCNHDMGIGTMEIITNEVIMALAAAGACGVTMFRVGTCGGLGEDAGTVVIADKVWSEQPQDDFVDEDGSKYVPINVCGEKEWWPGDMDQETAQKLQEMAQKHGITSVIGGVMSKLRFYAGEARIDGATCFHGPEKATAFFKWMHEKRIRKSEMEAIDLVSLCALHGIRHAVICVVLDNCMTHESINFTPERMKEIESRPIEVLLNLFAEEMGIELKPNEKAWLKGIIQSLFV